MIELLIKLQAWSQTFQWYKTFKRIGITLLILLIGLVIYLEVNDSSYDHQEKSGDSSYITNYESVEGYKTEVAAMDESVERDSFIAMVDAASQEDLEVDDAEFTAIYAAYNKITGNNKEGIAGK